MLQALAEGSRVTVRRADLDAAETRDQRIPSRIGGNAALGRL
jgi:hypothetical protein